jgi:hypothetical protein
LKRFAEWLSLTSPSVFIQNHNAWMIPAIQSIHIVAIGIVMGSVLLIELRVLGWAGMDQTLGQTTRRFGPWLTGGLCLLLATGILMVVGEPVRELVTFSFWLKMFLVAVSAGIALVFLARVRKQEAKWGETILGRRSTKWAAVLVFLIWMCVIILGRLIAYDHVWGPWSPATKA